MNKESLHLLQNLIAQLNNYKIEVKRLRKVVNKMHDHWLMETSLRHWPKFYEEIYTIVEQRQKDIEDEQAHLPLLGDEEE